MIYFLEAKGLDLIKIGFALNVDQRVESLQTASPVSLELIKVLEGDMGIERQIHLYFRESHSRREWFVATDRIRKFELTDLPEIEPVEIADPNKIYRHVCAGCGVPFARTYQSAARIPRRPFHNIACKYANGKAEGGNKAIAAARHPVAATSSRFDLE